MKNTTLLLLVILVSNRLYAQESYPMDQFELRSPGVLYVTATDSLTGTVKYNELTSGGVSIINSAGDSKRFSAKEILGFKTDNPIRRFYTVKSDGIDKSMMLYEDITPGGGKKLMLLKSFLQDGIVISGGQVKGKWENKMYAVGSKKLIGSNFKKVAEALNDCPALAEKITKKEKGYYFGMISTPMQQEQVLNNIVTEYNACP